LPERRRLRIIAGPNDELEWFSVTENNLRFAIKERSATEVTVEVTVDAQAVQDGILGVYRRYGREVQVPGFRKGHVPRTLLDSRFGKAMFAEEAQSDLEEKHLSEALTALSLRPVTPPQTKRVSFAEAEPFVFEATFSVLPDLALPEYRGIELSIPEAKPVTEEDVQAALEEIRRQYATLAPKEGDTVSAGDIVRVKEGKEEWDARAEAENAVTARLVGRKVGETVKVELDLPEGKTITTELTILGLKEVVLPELGDDLAKAAGHADRGSLETEVRKSLEKAHAKRRERVIKLGLVDRLLERLEIPLPTALVDQIAGEELERLKKNLSDPDSSVSFEDYLKRQEKTEDEMRSGYRELVTRRIRRELLLQKIAEKEGIAIDDEELERIATEEATEEGEDPLRFAARLKAEERWEDYRMEQANARVLGLLRDAAKIPEERT
jgi:trigger factor